MTGQATADRARDDTTSADIPARDLSDKPPVPASLEETGLSSAFVADLILKTLYVQGARTGGQIERFIRLPFPILDNQLLDLQQRRLVEVLGTTGHTRRGYTFDLTGEGRKRCRETMQTSRYVGAALEGGGATVLHHKMWFDANGCMATQFDISDEDAALIAAAPDLLAACKRISLDDPFNDSHSPYYTLNEDDATAIRAAIAKAEARTDG